MRLFLNMSVEELAKWHRANKIKRLDSRYLPPDTLSQILKGPLKAIESAIIGHSVTNHPISSLKIGEGSIRILLWSQMHGNESTTTRALLDALSFLSTSENLAKQLVSKLTLSVIPMLNPDGAKLFTRVNNVGVDLNRDAINLTQPESNVLKRIFLEFNPDFCFNLHDQRSIFGVGLSGVPATLSFLSPSANSERSVTPSRLIAMQIISGIKNGLSGILGSGIGRFSDEFNPNCVGDQFQMNNVPTILFEAGHYALDYQRNATREYLFIAFIEAFRLIAERTYADYTLSDYLSIPENSKSFADIHIYNPQCLNSSFMPNEILRLYFEEQLIFGEIIQKPVILTKDLGSGQFAHKVLDAKKTEDLNWIKSHPALSNYFE